MRIVTHAFLIAVGLGVLLLAPVYIAFQRDLAGHYERITHGSRVIETRCGAVELAEAGEGPPLLLVHGSGGGFDQGMLAGADFAQRGWHVIAPSRFGYLRTPFPADASAEAQADQFACLLDSLGVARASIMGVSAGANSALQFAIRHPERTNALVLLVPAAYKPTDAAQPPTSSALRERVLMAIVGSDFMFWAVTRVAHDTIVRTVLATPPEVLQRASQEEKERAERVLETILPISARARGLLNDSQIAGHPIRYALEDIHAPTLVISLRDDLYDTYASARYTAQHVRGARFIGFEQGGHIWIGHHAQIVDETSAFLRGAEAAIATAPASGRGD
ncbi:MAG TPA: alpha/beta fold hydrolase [Burkholderiaceae bacterium]|nr:alpha/beta fold hydrolase [Burkholderiaceae bacterium]